MRDIGKVSILLLALMVACLAFTVLNLIRGEFYNAASDAFVALCLLLVIGRSEGQI